MTGPSGSKGLRQECLGGSGTGYAATGKTARRSEAIYNILTGCIAARSDFVGSENSPARAVIGASSGSIRTHPVAVSAHVQTLNYLINRIAASFIL